jgi:FkbH-like protein
MAFSENQFIIGYEEFVSVRASYRSKSFEIEQLSHELNIGLKDFVLIDDNSVEIAEVNTALPAVTCIQFPKEVAQFPNMIDQVHSLFQISNITMEDKNRTALYQKMKRSTLDSSHNETDIDKFLKSLGMEMDLFVRTAVDNHRAVQLINKTNQFNSNGIRISKQQCDQLLESGASLITAKLKDKNGDHGEILAILIDANNKVLFFVMSCRVFQRQAEIIFMVALFKSGINDLSLDYTKTERNEPFKLFLSKFFPKVESGRYTLTPKLIVERYPRAQKLYKVKMY